MRTNVDKLDKRLALIVGPSGVGKSAIIRRLARDYGYHRVQSVTSRQPRKDDASDAYRYVTQEQAIHMIGRGDFAQYALHPSSGEVYGTLARDYIPGVNVLDAMAETAGRFRVMDFGRIATIGVIADQREWLRRLEERYPVAHPEHSGRRFEGERCLRWIGEHADFVVDTTDIGNDEAAQMVSGYVEGALSRVGDAG